MNTTEVLLKQHGALKKEIWNIAGDFFQDDLTKRIREFIFDYQDHEELEEVLLKKLIQTQGRSEEARILRSYSGIHAGADILLKELKNFIEAGNIFYVQRAFYNFYLITLSHFDYEERTIYPLIERVLKDETVEMKEEDGQAELNSWGGNTPNERYSRLSHF